MRIDKIDLKNYRCFGNLPIVFHPRMTVLVALNGQGKTSILDAIKVALWPFVAGFDLGSTTNDVTSIQVDDVRREQALSHEMDWRLPTEISAAGQLKVRKLILDNVIKDPSVNAGSGGTNLYTAFASDIPWRSTRYRESIKKATKTKDMIFNDAINLSETAKALEKRIFSERPDKPDDLPMLGYYGTGRLWAQKKMTAMQEKTTSATLSRTYAYRDCLDPASSYKSFAVWFTRVHKAYFQAQIRNLEKRLPVMADVPYELIAPFKAVQQAVDTMLKAHTGWHSLEYSAEHEELVLNHEQNGTLKVSQLSDGIRNMLALVGDIAYRCYKLNAHLGEAAPMCTYGIVMIDEVDMHLHPSWQQTVILSLQNAFPKIQFIVTTHSPQVLSTVRRENIRVIEQLSGGDAIAEPPLAMSYGELSGDVLQSVMMVDPQPPVSEKADLQRLTEWVDQGDYETDDANTLMQNLCKTLDENHPQLQKLKRSIMRQEAMKK